MSDSEAVSGRLRRKNEVAGGEGTHSLSAAGSGGSCGPTLAPLLLGHSSSKELHFLSP